MLVLIIILILIFLVIALISAYRFNRAKYLRFIKHHSVSLKRINYINSKYYFEDVPDLDQEHSYDNENFYDDISTEDYLTYQLVYCSKEAERAILLADKNYEMMKDYYHEINELCILNTYDTQVDLRNRKYLKALEKEVFKEAMLTPITTFDIGVTLNLTKINNEFVRRKRRIFTDKEIKEIIRRLRNKKGFYYTDPLIWESICRVERGKVSNKMRFAIYERDGYRCRICGSKNNLEIDHIKPIAKGGKSTFDNLQTLCHRCNARKGSDY